MQRAFSLTLLALTCLALAPTAHAQVTIDFDTLPANTIVTNQFPEATFSTSTGNNIRTFALGTIFGTSAPNIIAPSTNGVADGTLILNVTFTNPVSGLTFNILGVNDTGTIANADIFTNGSFNSTVAVVGASNLFTPLFFDLSAFTNVTSIQINNISDISGIAYDDFTFTPAAPAVPEPSSVALLTGLSLTGAAFLRRRKQNAHKAA